MKIVKNAFTGKGKCTIIILCGVVIGFLFAVVGCDKLRRIHINDGETRTNTSNDTITLGYRQIYCDTTKDFCLQLDSVLNDSRCPSDAICCWAGIVGVSFGLTYGGNQHCNFGLCECGVSRATTDTTINNLYFKLLSVEPYPNTNNMPIKQEDYEVTILVLQN
jgi:hypothetical protein